MENKSPDYWKIIKELQLDGTLDAIHEEIRLHYEKQFEDRRIKQEEDYKSGTHSEELPLVHMHFIDKLMEHLQADKEIIEEINYIHYMLLIDDEEFKESRKKYDDKVKAIEEEKQKAYMDGLKDSISKADPKTLKTAMEMIEKFLGSI